MFARAAELTAGASFWAGAPGASGLEARWQQQRENLAADWKRKRREAMKKSSHAAKKSGQ